MITIRPIREEDAEQFLTMQKRVDAETKFMLFEPGERNTTVEQTREMIRSGLAAGTLVNFVAEADGRIVGWLGANRRLANRIRHKLYIVIGMEQAYAGQGVGTRLFQAIEEWGRANGIHRLELTVMCHNERGVALYRKMGYEIEGVEKHGLCVDGQWVDQYYMAKLL